MAGELGYCVVANVAEETASGEGGLEIRSGTRHFSPGTKVWVLPAQWGDGGEKLFVVGRHRGARRRYVRLVVPRAHLVNFRARTIHSPAVWALLQRPWQADGVGPRLWETMAQAEEAAGHWAVPRLRAQLEDDPVYLEVVDPPPAELEHEGHTYHLAHFNARRALYCWLEPPPEPGVAGWNA